MPQADVHIIHIRRHQGPSPGLPRRDKTDVRMRFLPFFLLLISGIGTCHARTICVFDMAGSQGPVMNSLKEYTLAARSRGVSLSLRAYTDERVAAEDFKAGQCEGFW